MLPPQFGVRQLLRAIITSDILAYGDEPLSLFVLSETVGKPTLHHGTQPIGRFLMQWKGCLLYTSRCV